MYLFTVEDGATELYKYETDELGLGIVGVYHNGEWRNLTNSSGWDDTDVQVVCRQLGYSVVTYSLCSSSTCPPINCSGAVKLWTNEVHCAGQEIRLIDCADTWTPGNYCNNTYIAASVKCSGTTYIIHYVCENLCTRNTEIHCIVRPV